jgi:TrpR-related protein YerC/YecD
MSLPRNEQIDEFFKSVILLESIDECYKYFEDICTVKEVQTISQRLAVAKALAQGDNYQQASEKTGASSATVGRVKRCLDYGAGGYEMMLNRLK